MVRIRDGQGRVEVRNGVWVEGGRWGEDMKSRGVELGEVYGVRERRLGSSRQTEGNLSSNQRWG